MLLHYYLLFIVVHIVINCIVILYIYIIRSREKQKQADGKEEREPGRRMLPTSSPVPRLSSVPSAVRAPSRSSLPSSSAVSVILRPDLVRSLSSVRPSVFLFPVPRSPSCRLTANPTPSAHYFTMSHHRQGGKGSPRPVLVVKPSPTPRHRSTSKSKQQQGSASTVRHPPRLVLVLVRQVVRAGQNR